MSNYENCHFKGQRDNEVILHIIHRHWFNILVQFLGVLIAFLFLLLGMATIQTLAAQGNIIINPVTVYFLGNTILLFIWFFGFFIWIDYWFDIWIVTNQRIVNIEQRALFVREISELHLERVQDVTSEITGLIPSILNYGDVVVQTAGEQKYFRFRRVPDPNGIKDAIMRLVKSRVRQTPGRPDLVSASVVKDAFEEKG